LLLLIPPRTLAIVIAGMFVSFWLKIGSLPLNDAERRALIVSTAIVSAIAQLAGWLIYGARQTDHDQKILIRTQNAQLGRQNQELDEIMAITAHDLRGPLHGVRNMLDLAARRDPGGQETALFRAVRESMFSLDAMLGLVTRLLDAHAVEHRPLTAPAEEDLRTHLLAAARRIGPQTAAAAIDLDVRLPEQPIFAVLEGGALGQILDNLLGNAVRHSPPGAPLSLSCVRTDDRVLVAVEDRGPGIDPLHRDALFTKFGRMGPRGPHSGAGMGLFIAHTLAGRIGATLSFRPAAPNGAIFELALPNRGLISLSRTEPVVDKIML
jgi:signal transduction histidine kinase